MTADQATTEARARIIWGEPSSSVRNFLVSNGVSDNVADTKIMEFVVERNTEIKRIGIRSILVGITLVIASGGLVAYWIFSYGWRVVVVMFGRGFGRGFIWLALIGLIGLYGIWKLLRGVIRLLCPQTEHKSLSDIPE